MVALPSSIDWNYLEERIRRYNQKPSDDLLYRIGTHVDVLSPEEGNRMKQQAGHLHPEQRYRVLNWIVCCQNTVKIETDLALLIFGRDQLTQWLKRSRIAYPDFEFYLLFEFHPSHQSGWESGINFSMHWMPRPGAPEPDVDCDFPWTLYWESGDMFWGDWMTGGNQFEFNLSCYPEQRSFSTYHTFCQEGDCYTTPSDEEADLMSVAQVLEHFPTEA